MATLRTTENAKVNMYFFMSSILEISVIFFDDFQGVFYRVLQLQTKWYLH